MDTAARALRRLALRSFLLLLLIFLLLLSRPRSIFLSFPSLFLLLSDPLSLHPVIITALLLFPLNAVFGMLDVHPGEELFLESFG